MRVTGLCLLFLLPKEAAAQADTPAIDFRDWTSREGLGESPGVTALEYLGTGYDIFKGNPRGGVTTELDPGFRCGVIKLEQDQARTTINTEYTVPLGTEMRYVTSCK